MPMQVTPLQKAVLCDTSAPAVNFLNRLLLFTPGCELLPLGEVAIGIVDHTWGQRWVGASVRWEDGITLTIHKKYATVGRGLEPVLVTVNLEGGVSQQDVDRVMATLRTALGC